MVRKEDRYGVVTVNEKKMIYIEDEDPPLQKSGS